MNKHARIAAIILTTGLGAALTGCGNDGRVTAPPPQGNTGGRVDPYRSTPIDSGSFRASTVDLLQFSDQVGQALAARIGRVPEIYGAPDRVFIELGELQNLTNTPTSDFLIMRRRIFAALVNSDAVTRHAAILESPEVMDHQRGRLGPDGRPEADRNDPRATYVLQGYFGELTRGDGLQSNYYYEITLTNLQTRQIVFTEQFDAKQIR